MKPTLSILCPGIRPQNWQRLYESVEKSTRESFELICCGPFAPPSYFDNILNFKYIKDWGNPTRAQQLCLMVAEGSFCTWSADDGWFLPNQIDEGLLLDWKNIDFLTQKYLEGDGNTEHMRDDSYYLLQNSNCTSADFIHSDIFILNVGIIPTRILLNIGGFDSQFEVPTIAYADLAVRLYNAGYRTIMQSDPVYQCTHYPGTSGDHGPIHHSQIEDAQPLFKNIYNQEVSIGRKNIDLNNWKQSPSVWKRRFSIKTEIFYK